jgi:intergrase/recombinase
MMAEKASPATQETKHFQKRCRLILGPSPKKLGAKHYMQLKQGADQYHPRYAEYVTELRRKAGISS